MSLSPFMSSHPKGPAREVLSPCSEQWPEAPSKGVPLPRHHPKDQGNGRGRGSPTWPVWDVAGWPLSPPQRDRPHKRPPGFAQTTQREHPPAPQGGLLPPPPPVGVRQQAGLPTDVSGGKWGAAGTVLVTPRPPYRTRVPHAPPNTGPPTLGRAPAGKDEQGPDSQHRRALHRPLRSPSSHRTPIFPPTCSLSPGVCLHKEAILTAPKGKDCPLPTPVPGHSFVLRGSHLTGVPPETPRLCPSTGVHTPFPTDPSMPPSRRPGLQA